MLQKELMTVDELAKYFKTTKSAIYKKVYNREIPFIRHGKWLRFDPQKIDEWISNRSYEAVKRPWKQRKRV